MFDLGGGLCGPWPLPRGQYESTRMRQVSHRQLKSFEEARGQDGMTLRRWGSLDSKFNSHELSLQELQGSIMLFFTKTTSVALLLMSHCQKGWTAGAPVPHPIITAALVLQPPRPTSLLRTRQCPFPSPTLFSLTSPVLSP